MKYIPRKYEEEIKRYLPFFSVVGLIGPRQSGKTTLIKNIEIGTKVYLDVENSRDRNKLTDAISYFTLNKNSIICIDEIQFCKDIFVELKSFVDITSEKGKFIILGSASPELLNQSSETLAGRIVYIKIHGFQWEEISHLVDFNTYWLRGTLPDSLLASSDEISFVWRQSYISTFFNRDLLSIKGAISAQQVSRLFTMLAHLHGETLDITKLSRSLGIKTDTVKKYIDILIGAFQLIMLPPYTRNTGKRLIKSPKMYIADQGLLHCLLDIETMDELYGHPVYGSSFEGLIITNIMNKFNKWQFSFYRTSNGAEIDLIMQKANKTIAVEIKANSSPTVTRGFWNVLDDLNVDQSFIIAPVEEMYPYRNNTVVCNLESFLKLNL